MPRYTLTGALPVTLRYRNGRVVVELVRDCMVEVPTWVLRARRLPDWRDRRDRGQPPHPLRATLPPPRVTYPAAIPAGGRLPMPTIAPIERAMAATLAADPAIIVASSIYGRYDLQRILRAGFAVEPGSAVARVCDALVRIGVAVTV